MPTGYTEAEMRAQDRQKAIQDVLGYAWSPTAGEYAWIAAWAFVLFGSAVVVLTAGIINPDVTQGQRLTSIFGSALIFTIAVMHTAERVAAASRRRSDRLLAKLAEKAGINPNSV